ncbi:hypothetical protein PMAYCL1PPCAC_02199, partial [Pristionchus mayeri]
MFLISKIVRGRRLLHELEAQEAKEGIDLTHLTKRNQQHRKSSPVLFVEDELLSIASCSQHASLPHSVVSLALIFDLWLPSRMRREARSQSCRVHPQRRGTPKRSARLSTTSIDEHPR